MKKNRIILTVLSIVGMLGAFMSGETEVAMAACVLNALPDADCETPRISGVTKIYAALKRDLVSFTAGATAKTVSAIVKATGKAFVQIEGTMRKASFTETVNSDDPDSLYFSSTLNSFRAVLDEVASNFIEKTVGQELVVVFQAANGKWLIAGNLDTGIYLGSGTTSTTGDGLGGGVNGTALVFTQPYSAKTYNVYTGTEADLLVPGT